MSNPGTLMAAGLSYAVYRQQLTVV